MIVVTGATGHVGGELVAQAAERNLPVRAVTRRPDPVAFPPGVEVVYGNFDEPASIDAAFDGADRAFLMSTQVPGSAAAPTHDLLLAQAARRAGVRHVAKLSVLDGGAGEDAIGVWHREAEAAVVDSGMDWTLLRPGRFMTNTLGWAPMISQGDTVQVPSPRRRRSRSTRPTSPWWPWRRSPATGTATSPTSCPGPRCSPQRTSCASSPRP